MDKLQKAIEHSVNYHSLDAKLNMPDFAIAALITPEVQKYLDGTTDVQHYETGKTQPVGEQLELDCYHKAEADEPKFTLLARDPLAAYLVAMWAALRKGDTASAVVIFSDAVADPGYNYRAKSVEGDTPEKLKAACDISRNMITWRGEKGLEAFEVHNVA